MEVHAHTHTPRKKWTHYFWEFLMLFLAITLGFFVENQREHYIEHVRSRQYALSLIDDLKYDTTALKSLVEDYKRNILKIDTFRNKLKSVPLSEIPGGSLYYYCGPALWVLGITFHDATIQQLKNSGNLRYFPPALQYEISEYDRKARELSARQENEIYFSRITREMMTGVFDSELIIEAHNFSSDEAIDDFKQKDIKLLIRDTVLIRKIVNEIIYRHASWQYRFKEIVQPTHQAAIELLTHIKNEFRFD